VARKLLRGFRHPGESTCEKSCLAVGASHSASRPRTILLRCSLRWLVIMVPWHSSRFCMARPPKHIHVLLFPDRRARRRRAVWVKSHIEAVIPFRDFSLGSAQRLCSFGIRLAVI
jgi:hypothetical protein